MTGDENPVKPKKKKRRLIGLVFSLLSLAILTYIAITLISGRELGLSRLLNVFSARVPVEAVDEFYFDVGRNRVFADLGGSIVAAGTLGIQVFNEGGGETLRDSVPHVPAGNQLVGRARHSVRYRRIGCSRV
jgi:hypothetical protein